MGDHAQPTPGTDQDVHHEDWDRRDLSGQVHRRVSFVDVDLTETTSVGALFECSFRDVSFNASVHTDTAFTNCTFTRCSFFGAAFDRCKLVGSRFDRCRFGAVKITGGDWSFVGLPGANLSGSTLEDVRMREADLTGARIDGGKVTGVDLSGAWLHDANLCGCDLRGSDLSTLDPLTTRIDRAVIDVDQAIVVAGALGLDVRPPLS